MSKDPVGIDWRTVGGRMEAKRRLIDAETENERLQEALRRIAAKGDGTWSADRCAVEAEHAIAHGPDRVYGAARVGGEKEGGARPSGRASRSTT